MIRQLREAQDLHYQGPIKVHCRFRSNMFYSVLPIASQKIETQTICCGVDRLDQSMPQLAPLIWSYGTLEDRFLHPLSKVEAGLSHTCQSSLSSRLGSGYVVSHQDHHRSAFQWFSWPVSSFANLGNLYRISFVAPPGTSATSRKKGGTHPNRRASASPTSEPGYGLPSPGWFFPRGRDG